MHRTRIKICGVCRVEDAVAAARAGADAIGLVFHPASPRNVTYEQARAIITALPPFVTPVGLFVDAPVWQVGDFCFRLGIRHAQLHGRETPGDVQQIMRMLPATLLKAVRVQRGAMRAELDEWRRAIRTHGLTTLRGFVLETATASANGAPGGTGIENDWDAIRAEQQAGTFDGLPMLVAAGGLKPENVTQVVRTLRPWAVDVSSGVEAAKGRKSEDKIRAFIEAVREADQAVSTER